VVTICTASLTLKILRSAHTLYLCVLCGSQNKQPLFPNTSTVRFQTLSVTHKPTPAVRPMSFSSSSLRLSNGHCTPHNSPHQLFTNAVEPMWALCKSSNWNPSFILVRKQTSVGIFQVYFPIRIQWTINYPHIFLIHGPGQSEGRTLLEAVKFCLRLHRVVWILKMEKVLAQCVLQIRRSLFRSQLVSLEFFIDIKSFRSHYGSGVDSASNRNEYQEYFLGVKTAGP